MEILTEATWHERRAAHEARVRPWVEPRLRRMSLKERHPVDDFLFEYYSYRPGQLMLWHPGLGTAIEGESARTYLELKHYREVDGAITVDPASWPEKRREFPHWLRRLLRGIQSRPAVFGCFGLHEWAMVYRTENIRYEAYPLRLSPSQIAETVESLSLRCTHFDAFRFFTPAARPLNKLQPVRETIPALEQGGCLHANMDLYKWAFKLLPFSPSELVADTFELAREIRELDMRASPYDLSSLGYIAVPLETTEGRAEYERMQRDFSRRADLLRARLLPLCEQLIAHLPAELV
jgi:hypothetical protein